MRMLLPCILVLSLTQSCSFNSPVQKKGVAGFQGEWRQDTALVQRKLVTYSLYNFSFTCDSFFVQINTRSSFDNGADSCMSRGKWTEFAKGNYDLHQDTLSLKGLFCNADKKLKTEKSCLRFGIYQEDFIAKPVKESVYELINTASRVPFRINLIKHITCIQKPL